MAAYEITLTVLLLIAVIAMVVNHHRGWLLEILDGNLRLMREPRGAAPKPPQVMLAHDRGRTPDAAGSNGD